MLKNNFSSQQLRILETVWLILALLGLFTGIYDTFTRGIEHSYPFFIIAAIAFGVYSLRRSMRRNSIGSKKQ